MKKNVTRNDVAREAGVSPPVVSYVLNNSNYVSPESRRAVEAAIRKLNYAPNAFARGLKTRSTNHIALIGDWLAEDLFSSIASSLFEAGFYSSLSYSQIKDEFLDMLVSRQFEGIFLTSNSYSTSQLNRLVNAGIHLVLLQSRHYENLDTRIVLITPDYAEGIVKAINYLVFKNHKQIGLIPPLKFQTDGIMSNDFRMEGYKKGMRQNNLEIFSGNVATHTQTIESVCGDILNMISSPNRPTALIVSDDYLAAQIIQFLAKLEIRVPEDMAIVGWGNSPTAVITTPQLTTLDASIPLVSQKAVESLLALIKGQRPENQSINVELVIRNSA